MACNTGNYFWSGTSFASCIQLYTDSNLTIVAPDGIYSIGGITRVMTLGVLGPQAPCPSCIVPCGTGINGSGNQGQYLLSMDVGLTTGAVIVRFTPLSYPDKCTWTYDGVSASEYSSPTYGYLQGVIGTIAHGVSQCNPDIINATGSMNPAPGLFFGNEYDYDPVGNVFVNNGNIITMGPYADQASGGVDLTVGIPGFSMMVVPKPNTTPTTMDLVIDGPCGGTAWQLTVECPIPLNAFQCKPHPAACADPVTDPFYTAHPGTTTGVATSVFVHDWAFEDVNGVTHKAAGQYLVDNNGSADCVTVSADGVVTSVAACGGSC